MSEHDNQRETRRRLLKVMGQTAVIVPLAGLTTACGGGEEAPASSAPAAPAESADSATNAVDDMANKAEDAMDDAEARMEEAMNEAEDTVEDAMDDAKGMAEDAMGDMPLVSEDDPMAQQLGYVQDATTVDATKFPRYQAGQACANCALYVGEGPQGACSIFPGRNVKGTGWCSVYAPKG